MRLLLFLVVAAIYIGCAAWAMHRRLIQPSTMFKRIRAGMSSAKRDLKNAMTSRSSSAGYDANGEYEYREAEYEYEGDKEPEQRNAPKEPAPFFSTSMSTARPR